MVQRVFRLILAGFCLMLGIGCILLIRLDWRSRSLNQGGALNIGRTHLQWTANQGAMSLEVVRPWPGGPVWETWAGIDDEETFTSYLLEEFDPDLDRGLWEWRHGGVYCGSALVGFWIKPNGLPGKGIGSGDIGHYLHGVPYWYAGVEHGWWLIVLTAIPPLTWTWFAGRRIWIATRRRRSKLCLNCGYDTRASPRRCPECAAPARVGESFSDSY
jgi:hypothetical protein